jgi:hypothetical protein
MIFYRPVSAYPAHRGQGVRQAWRVFVETQESIYPPYGIVLQPEHARLAGQLARNLLPHVFGELPPEVITAIGEHDAGWQRGDGAQLAAIGERHPRPFPLLTAGEAIPYWEESVRHAREISTLAGVVVSRHFCALAGRDPALQAFLEEEAPRRESIECALDVPAGDLDRWTAAIGFCDILSLCLCSGTREPVELPLAHPALPDARDATRVLLGWVDGRPRFSPAVVNPDQPVSVAMLQRRGRGTQLEPETISWSFAL